MILTSDELKTIQQHAINDYPREACGVILVHGRKRRLLRFKNVQDELHTKDPDTHQRTAKEAYSVSVEDLKLLNEMIDMGITLKVIYHSHIDAQSRGNGTGAYFSETDKKNALAFGRPIFPGTTYVVASVISGQIEAVKGFRWNSRREDFSEIDLWRLSWHEQAAELAGRTWAWVGQLATRPGRLR